LIIGHLLVLTENYSHNVFNFGIPYAERGVYGVYKGVRLKSKLKHSGSRKPQLFRTTACVIAQQYSSVTFVSLLIQSHKEKFRSPFENVTTSILAVLFKNFVSLNLM